MTSDFESRLTEIENRLHRLETVDDELSTKREALRTKNTELRNGWRKYMESATRLLDTGDIENRLRRLEDLAQLRPIELSVKHFSSQTTALIKLLLSSHCTWTAIEQTLYGHKIDGAPILWHKIISARIDELRALGVEIKSIHGVGYALTEKGRAVLGTIMGDPSDAPGTIAPARP